MDRMIFVNLPVADVAAARHFYTGLGFTVNEQFSDDRGACIVVSDAIYVMLLERSRFAGFATLPVADARVTTGVITSLSTTSRDEADELLARALAHGGTAGTELTEGGMYGHTFLDPDGHVWEVFHLAMPDRS